MIFSDPSVIRNLFDAKVPPVIDYASPVRLYARRASAGKVPKRVQRIGVWAVIGCFHMMGMAVAEVDDKLHTIAEWHMRNAVGMCGRPAQHARRV